jgi:ribosomal protein S12 methylthiotransferase accessory factor
VSGPPADLEPLVDVRVGAATLAEVEPATTDGAAALAVAHARFAAPHPQEVRHDSEGWTHGAAATEDEAKLVALAEALERYCGVFTPRPAAVAAYATLDEEALWPPALPLYSARQYARPGFPFAPFEPRQALPWAWGHNLVTGRSLLVPQDAVRYGPAPSRLVHESSSGVAAHTSPEAAVLGATLEVVERDALMIFWLNRLSPPLADLTHHSHPFVAAVRGDVHRMGYELRLADLTTDLGIPVMLAIATREDLEGPALVLGAGASLDPVRAVTKALRELLGSLRSWQGVDWAGPERLEPDEVRELADHARAYHHPSWLSRADFLWSSDARSTLPLAAGDDSPPADQLATCVSRLTGAGLELIAADLTTPDIGARGLRVMRAIVPGAQPIGFGPTGLRLGGRRLYTAPSAMGFTSTDTSEECLNPDPHCFP